MNRIILIGRLVKDPEKRVLEESGKVVAKFTIVVEREFRNANGDREVDFIPVVLWGKKAEAAAEFLTKGSLISVCGRLANRSYEDEQGVKRYVSEVVADSFQPIEIKKASEDAV